MNLYVFQIEMYTIMPTTSFIYIYIYICVCVCVCVHLCECMCQCVYLSECASVWVSKCVCLWHTLRVMPLVYFYKNFHRYREHEHNNILNRISFQLEIIVFHCHHNWRCIFLSNEQDPACHTHKNQHQQRQLTFMKQFWQNHCQENVIRVFHLNWPDSLWLAHHFLFSQLCWM